MQLAAVIFILASSGCLGLVYHSTDKQELPACRGSVVSVGKCGERAASSCASSYFKYPHTNDFYQCALNGAACMEAGAACKPGASSSGVAWIKGGNGQVCNAVCKGKGFSGCDKAKMAGLTSNALVKEAFQKAGHTCRTFHAPRNYAGTPFSKGRHRHDDCAPVSRGTPASQISCDRNNYGHHAPLCACKGGGQAGQSSAQAGCLPAWKGTKLADNFWLTPPSGINRGGRASLGLAYKAGTQAGTQYLMWSPRASILIQGDGRKVTVLCNHHGVHHRATSSGNVRDGKWHQLFFVWAGSSLTLYVDGVKGPTNRGCGSFVTSWRFGNHPCELSTMSLWKRQLTDSEVKSDKTLFNSNQDLVSRYPLGDKKDKQRKGKDLQLTGGSFKAC